MLSFICKSKCPVIKVCLLSRTLKRLKTFVFYSSMFYNRSVYLKWFLGILVMSCSTSLTLTKLEWRSESRLQLRLSASVAGMAPPDPPLPSLATTPFFAPLTTWAKPLFSLASLLSCLEPVGSVCCSLLNSWLIPNVSPIFKTCTSYCGLVLQGSTQYLIMKQLDVAHFHRD